MPVDIKIAPESITAYISGELDHHTTVSIREDIDTAIEKTNPVEVVLDFGGVTFMDSSGIGLVMGRYKLTKEIGAVVSVCGLNNQTAKVMRVAGLEQLVKIKTGGSKNENH